MIADRLIPTAGDTMHIYAHPSGEDWFVAADADSARREAREAGYEDDDGEMTQVPDGHPFSVMWDLGNPCKEVAAFVALAGVSVDQLDRVTGDGWTHRITAPACMWAAHFGPGLLSSANY